MRQLRNRIAPRQQRGFSVLEMMIALLIGAVVIVTARQLLHQLTLSDRRLEDDSRREATVRNTARQLTDVMSRLEVGTDSVSTFSGETTRAEFTTWCQVPRGWLERCAAALVIDTTASSNTLILVTAEKDSTVLRTDLIAASFRYFTDIEDPDSWVFRWGRGSSAPIGMAIVQSRDTLVLRIGGRG